MQRRGNFRELVQKGDIKIRTPGVYLQLEYVSKEITKKWFYVKIQNANVYRCFQIYFKENVYKVGNLFRERRS